MNAYPDTEAVNYWFFEKGIGDRGSFLESPWHRFWPWKMRGRNLLSKTNDFMPFALWRKNQLTHRGRRELRRIASRGKTITHCLAIVHDEFCATRVNSITNALGVPFQVILYDLMHLEAPNAKNFPELAKCLSNANCVFAISQPLRNAAKVLGAKKIESIAFYRPRQSVMGNVSYKRVEKEEFKIAVLADAKAEAFDELLSSVKLLNQEKLAADIQIHFIGDAKGLSSLSDQRQVDVKYHGFVSSAKRDEIMAGCDIAFLAGSILSASSCPLARYSIPSKLGDFAGLGLPVIARVSGDSAAAAFIREEASRFVQLVTGVDETVRTLRSLIGSKEALAEMKSEALRFAEEKLYLPNSVTDSVIHFGCHSLATPKS
jgi:hypothetical protein